MEQLQPKTTPGASVRQLDERSWRLEIPNGPRRRYRLAQLDDYTKQSREAFRWRPPFSMRLQARAATWNIPGTWGFGLWNDPFGFSFGFGGAQRFPALPNAAWFFFASPPNYLSLRDDLPAQGALAATFRSPHVLPLFFGLGLPALPFLAIPATARPLRKLARRWIHQDASLLNFESPQGKWENSPTEWHTFDLQWQRHETSFRVDGLNVLTTPVSPAGPMGLVIWLDNQYASLPPSGGLSFGTLANPESVWVEIADLELG